MGISILELVVRQLREAGFTADKAYPGQKCPPITGTVAAVHIAQVDRSGMSVTVEVNILSPAALGGTGCELEALRATEVLGELGAVCIQKGCRYDGVAQVYVVSVSAEFTAVTGADSYSIGRGFYVYLDNVGHPFATAFSQEEVSLRRQEYTMGQTAPAGTIREGTRWDIQLEELIPVGKAEPKEPKEGFELKVVTQLKTEFYTGCRWNSIRREYTKDGLRRIRKGTAEERREAENGSTAV